MNQLMNMFELHNTQLVLLSGKISLFLGVVQDDDLEFYFLVREANGNYGLVNCFNLFVPLIERLNENEYKFYNDKIGIQTVDQEEYYWVVMSLLNDGYSIHGIYNIK